MGKLSDPLLHPTCNTVSCAHSLFPIFVRDLGLLILTYQIWDRICSQMEEVAGVMVAMQEWQEATEEVPTVATSNLTTAEQRQFLTLLHQPRMLRRLNLFISNMLPSNHMVNMVHLLVEVVVPKLNFFSPKNSTWYVYHLWCDVASTLLV